jgi:hypothetical protein
MKDTSDLFLPGSNIAGKRLEFSEEFFTDMR